MLAQLGLGGRREEGRFKLVRFPHAGRQLIAAERAGLLIVFPARAGNVAAYDTFHRQGLCLADQYGTPFKFVLPGGKGGGEPVHIAFHQMIGDDVLELVHPEQGDLVQDHALVGDGLVHDDIEGGHAVGCDDEQGLVVDVIDVANLAAGQQRVSADFSLGGDAHSLDPVCLRH